jgi:histone H3/H4
MYQRAIAFMIPPTSFIRLVRGITDDKAPSKTFRFQRSALHALQEAAEEHLVHLFESIFSNI